MKPESKYTQELKVSPSGEIEGWGIPFGGPLANDSDLDGERFSKNTDFHFDWFPDGRPMLYDHGTDQKLGLDLIGRQTEHEVVDEVGVWVKAQINMSHKYADAVMELIADGKVGFSSLAMRHLIDKDRKGNILEWPWIEQTLTVHPAHPMATIDEFKMVTTFADAMKQLGLDVPKQLTAEPPKKGKAIDLPNGMSTDDLRDALLLAAKEGYPSLFTGDDAFPWVDVIYDGKAVLSVSDQHYEVAYSVDGETGAVTVSGAPAAVVRRTIWEPESKTSDSALWTPSKQDPESFIDLADMAKTSLSDVEAFIGSAESLVEAVREKDEQLSGAKRTLLTDLGIGVRAAGDRLEELLKEETPGAPSSDSRPSWRARSLVLEQGIRDLAEVS